MNARKSKKESIIHLRNFGCLIELWFTDGGWARVQMDQPEIAKMMVALEKLVLRRHEVPPLDILDAVHRLQKYFSNAHFRTTIRADMRIAVNGVRLRPIIDYEELQKAPEHIR